MNRTLSILFFFLFTLVTVAAFDRGDPQSFLGLTIENLFETDAVPLDIRPQRGIEADEDNVLFFYGEGFSLFLFNNRVWQVRYDRRSAVLPGELRMGESRDAVLPRFLEEGVVPLSSSGDYITFQLRDTPWPIRMTLYFNEDKLDDVYVYRADF